MTPSLQTTSHTVPTEQTRELRSGRVGVPLAPSRK
jgi:hypothetical protein